MNCIISHIEYLIARHDCVVMPGWGAFVAHYEPAFYDDATAIFSAPRRLITFNPQISHADGMVAASVSRKQQITFEQASRIVNADIEAMRSQLSRDGEVSLGLLGSFVAQPEGSPLFVASNRLSAIESALFPSLHIDTLATRIKAREIAEAEEAIAEMPRLRRFGLKAIKAAAAVVLTIGIGYGLIVPILSQRHDEMASISAPATAFATSSQTSIVAPAKSAKELKIMVPPTMPDTESTESQIAEDSGSAIAKQSIACDADIVVNDKAVSSDTKAIVPANDDVRFDSADQYYLIVASLPTRQGAERFISENKGVRLDILEQDGKFRIYAATGSSNAEAAAQRQRSSLASRFADAWVCRRN